MEAPAESLKLLKRPPIIEHHQQKNLLFILRQKHRNTLNPQKWCTHHTQVRLLLLCTLPVWHPPLYSALTHRSKSLAILTRSITANARRICHIFRVRIPPEDIQRTHGKKKTASRSNAEGFLLFTSRCHPCETFTWGDYSKKIPHIVPSRLTGMRFPRPFTLTCAITSTLPRPLPLARAQKAHGRASGQRGPDNPKVVVGN